MAGNYIAQNSAIDTNANKWRKASGRCTHSSMAETEPKFDRRSLLKAIGIGTAGTVGAGVFTTPAHARDREQRQNTVLQSQGEGEPNDRQSLATYIRPGIVHGRIGPCCLPVVGDDDDWFVFDAQRGDPIDIEFRENAPAVKELIGPRGAVLDMGDYYSRRISGTAERTGSHYLHLGNPPGGANNNYSFIFRRGGRHVPPDPNPGRARTLTVSKGGTKPGRGAFAISTTGTISHGDSSEARIDGSSAIDWVGPHRGTDQLVISGQITNLLLKGPATVSLGGRTVNPNRFGTLRAANNSPSSSGLPNRLRITKRGSREEVCAFFVSVSGDLRPGRSSEAVFQGRSAIDWVGPARGTDEFAFSGRITEFLMKGNATVSVNGRRVDPDTLG